MKFSRRFFCVLLCFVLFSVVFSSTISADHLKIPTYYIDSNVTLITPDASQKHSFTFTPDNGAVEQDEFIMGGPNYFNDCFIITTYHLKPKGYLETLLTPNNEVDLSLLNCAYSNLLTFYTNGSVQKRVYDRSITQGRVLLHYTDGTSEYFDDVVQEQVSTYRSNFKVTVNPRSYVESIEFIFYNLDDDSFEGFLPNLANTWDITTYLGEYSSTENGWELMGYDQDENTQELKGIKGFISNIFDFLKQLPSKVFDFFDDALLGIPSKIFNLFATVLNDIKDVISDIVSSILDLPDTIVALFKDLIEYLFVPSEEYITSFYDEIDIFCEDTFGAVYQSFNIIVDSLENINTSAQTNIVKMPKVTIDLPQNNTFSFGGYDVKVVPNGFDFLVTSLKSIVGIVCTILVINSLRKKFDDIME